MKRLNKYGLYSQHLMLPFGLSLKEGEIKFVSAPSKGGIEIIGWRFHSNQAWVSFVEPEYPNLDIAAYVALTGICKETQLRLAWVPMVEVSGKGILHIYSSDLPETFKEVSFTEFVQKLHL